MLLYSDRECVLHARYRPVSVRLLSPPAPRASAESGFAQAPRIIQSTRSVPVSRILDAYDLESYKANGLSGLITFPAC